MTSADGAPPSALPELPLPPPTQSAAVADATLRTSGLRARRSLAASKSARDSITSVVESLRVPKPPRAPPTSESSSRHRPLSDLSRSRVLEDALSTQESETISLKRLYGRALVKRRAAERERDRLRAELAAVRRHNTEASDEFTPSAPPTPARAAVDDDVRSVRSMRSARSFVSSCIFGDDREAQLDALVDLIDMLDAKLSTTSAPSRATAALKRARSTLAAEQNPDADLINQRDTLQRQLDAATAASPDEAAVAALRAALADARAEAAAFRARAEALSRGMSAVADSGDGTEALRSELAEAKKTIARLVQERNALRRASSEPLTQIDEELTKNAPSADVVRRVLDWRERARSEVALPPRSADDDARCRRQRAIAGGPITVPVSEIRRSRMGRSRALDLRRLLGHKGAVPSTTTGKTRGGLFRNKSERASTADATTSSIAPMNGAARTEYGQAHLLPDRLRADLREPVNIRRALALSQDCMSERSVEVSEAESCTSVPHRIVGRNLSAVSEQQVGRELYGYPAQRSEGLKGLIGESML